MYEQCLYVFSEILLNKKEILKNVNWENVAMGAALYVTEHCNIEMDFKEFASKYYKSEDLASNILQINKAHNKIKEYFM